MRSFSLHLQTEGRHVEPWRALLADFSWLALGFCLLNAPFWWAARDNFLSRAVFNLDLLLPLWIARRRPGMALLALVPLWAVDLAVSESLAWHFHSPVEFLRSIEFLDSSTAAGFVAHSRWLVLGVPFAVAALAAIQVARTFRPGWQSMACMLFAVAGADVLNGSSFAWNRAVREVSTNIAGTGLKSTVQSALAAPRFDAVRPIPGPSAARSATAHFDVAGWTRRHPQGSVVLVLVESMGIHHDARMRDWLAGRLGGAEMDERFELRQASIAFDGGTTSGELRELCGLTGSYRAMTPALGRDCLPAQLGALGWKTLGLHGFSRRMFLREAWWPEVGLQRSLFAEDLERRPGVVRCGGAFPGLCDDTMVKVAVQSARAPASFAYLVTLNSHLPLEGGATFADVPAPCAAAAVGDDVCSHAAVLSRVLAALRRELLASPVAPLVVVVGDHSPPFSRLSSRGQFDDHEVPAFALIPKP